jgi:hypothetical protein
MLVFQELQKKLKQHLKINILPFTVTFLIIKINSLQETKRKQEYAMKGMPFKDGALRTTKNLKKRNWFICRYKQITKNMANHFPVLPMVKKTQ